jgi:hypothetical protein
MTLFKKITTKKADPLAELVKALGDALQVALDAKVPIGPIAHELERRAAHFRRMVDFALEQRRDNPIPQMFDQVTLKPIDGHAIAARAEERRNAEELRRQQRQYAESVNERAEREAFLRR